MFEPLMIPPNDLQKAYWIIFDGDNILMHATEAAPLSQLPSFSAKQANDINFSSTLYLGKFKQQHLFTAAISKEKLNAETNHTWHPFRDTLHLFDEHLYQIANSAKQLLMWEQSNQFCSRCGHKLLHQSHERSKLCNSCGYVCYPKVSPCVIVLIHDQENVVLAQAHRYQSNMYGLIAGYIEPGETAEQAAIREVQEEVGLQIKNLKYFATQPWPFPHLLMIGFLAEYESGEIIIEKEELRDARWFSIHKLPEIPIPGSIAYKMLQAHIDTQTHD